MPYKTFMEDGKHCVYKLDADGNQAGKSLGCHDSEDEAKSQVQALYANEEKELKTKMYDESGSFGAASLSEVMAAREAHETAKSIKELASLFPEIVSNIMYREDISNKAAAIESLAQEFAQMVSDTTTKEMQEKATWSTAFINDLPDSSFLYIAPGGNKEDGKTAPRNLRFFPVKDASGKVDLPHLRSAIARIPQAKHDTLTKEKKDSLQEKARRMLAEMEDKEAGLVERIYNKVKEKLFPSQSTNDFMLWKEKDGYHWLATYSNNIIDDEKEIISSRSHKRFVEMVDKEQASLPELWLWHRPEWKWGQATNIAYDEAGFAIASGTVDKGCEPIAEWAMAQKGLAVSHGMPKAYIKRDESKPNVIIEHITKEISPLPYGNAANKLTGFTILKENEMTIPEDKRKKLLDSGLSEEALKALEAKNEQLSSEVKEAGLETKEDKPALTQEDFVKAIGLAVNPLAQQVATLAEQVSIITKEINSLKQSDTDKVKALAESTPRDSLEELLRQEMPGLFTKETQVKEDDPLTKSGPEQTGFKEEDGLFFQSWASQDRRGVK